MRRKAVFLAVITLGLTTGVAPAASAPPSNDAKGDAAKVEGIPAVSALNLSGATSEPGEDTSCGGPGTAWYVWRAKTAEPVTVGARSQFPGGSGPIGIHVYRKVRAELTSIACEVDSLTFTPEPATHYLFQIAGSSDFVNVRWRHGFGGGASADDAFNIVAPPFPFSEIVPLSSPVGPAEPRPICAVPGGSRWYAFKAPAPDILRVHLDAVQPSYFQVYLAGKGGPTPIPGTCRATLSPHEGSDAFVPVLDGTQILIQYGHNVDPNATQGDQAAFGFFSLSPAP